MLVHAESALAHEFVEAPPKVIVYSDAAEGDLPEGLFAWDKQAMGSLDISKLDVASQADTGTPAPLPNRVTVNHSHYRGALAGSLAVPGFGGTAEASAESYTLVQDVYRAYAVDGGNGAPRRYYGGAVRLAVTVSNWKGELGLSLPLVAAKVDAHELRATYRFEVLGITDMSKLAPHLPLVGEFSARAYLDLITATNECSKVLLEAAIVPVLLFVETDAPGVNNIVYTYLHTLRHVAAHGADEMPVAGPGGANTDLVEWVRVATVMEARSHTDARGWAKARVDNLETTFFSK